VLAALAREAVATDTAADEVLADDSLTRLAAIPDSDIPDLFLASHVHTLPSVPTWILLRADRHRCEGHTTGSHVFK